MASGTFEPGGHPAQFVMLFQQQHAAALPGQDVGCRHARQATADDGHVISVFGSGEKIFGHDNYCENWSWDWLRS